MNDEILKMNICKIDPEQQLVFGFGSAVLNEDGSPHVDQQGDLIDEDTLETAVYAFMESSREVDAMHEGPVIGSVVESMLFDADKLAALGISNSALAGKWWIGLRIADAAAWDAVKSGRLTAFSIAGTGERSPLVEGGN